MCDFSNQALFVKPTKMEFRFQSIAEVERALFVKMCPFVDPA